MMFFVCLFVCLLWIFFVYSFFYIVGEKCSPLDCGAIFLLLDCANVNIFYYGNGSSRKTIKTSSIFHLQFVIFSFLYYYSILFSAQLFVHINKAHSICSFWFNIKGAWVCHVSPLESQSFIFYLAENVRFLAIRQVRATDIRYSHITAYFQNIYFC